VTDNDETPADDVFEYETGGDADVALRRITIHGGRQTGTIGPRPDHVLVWLSDGQAEITSDAGEHWTVEPQQLLMLSAPVAYAFDTTATRMSLLHLAPDFLRRVAGQADDVPWEFAQLGPSRERTAALRTLFGDLPAAILDPTITGEDRAALNRRIARGVLATFTPRRADAENRLRAAVAFVHANAGRDIDLADIAAAADLSERGVQDLFRRTLEVTPMQYLRDVRLDRVHLDLGGRGEIRGTTVTEVARRWRFAHVGRFASTYRQRFGESPSETLRRAGGTPTGES
jgi:AraC-like DNA-binding protein